MARSHNVIKHGALLLMVLQNAAFVLVMRYSRKQQHAHQEENHYSVPVVVVLQELFKLLLCLLIIFGTRLGGPILELRELARMLIPAACFTLQNNVLYVALSNLDPLLFQILYQIKTLLTALLSVLMLGRMLSRMQWLSQLLLTLGIILVQYNESAAAPAESSEGRSPLLGVAAVFAAAFSSSFASVFFERILKGGARNGAEAAATPRPGAQSSLWHKNTQLCFWTVPMNALLALLQSESKAQLLSDPLRGFEPSTWGVIVVNGLGGLLVACVIKYADNIWKGFATAAAVVLTGVLAPLLQLGPQPSSRLTLGAALCCGSVVMYAAAPSRGKGGNAARERAPLIGGGGGRPKV